MWTFFWLSRQTAARCLSISGQEKIKGNPQLVPLTQSFQSRQQRAAWRQGTWGPVGVRHVTFYLDFINSEQDVQQTLSGAVSLCQADTRPTPYVNMFRMSTQAPPYHIISHISIDSHTKGKVVIQKRLSTAHVILNAGGTMEPGVLGWPQCDSTFIILGWLSW